MFTIYYGRPCMKLSPTPRMAHLLKPVRHLTVRTVKANEAPTNPNDCINIFGAFFDMLDNWAAVDASPEDDFSKECPLRMIRCLTVNMRNQMWLDYWSRSLYDIAPSMLWDNIVPMLYYVASTLEVLRLSTWSHDRVGLFGYKLPHFPVLRKLYLTDLRCVEGFSQATLMGLNTIVAASPRIKFLSWEHSAARIVQALLKEYGHRFKSFEMHLAQQPFTMTGHLGWPDDLWDLLMSKLHKLRLSGPHDWDLEESVAMWHMPHMLTLKVEHAWAKDFSVEQIAALIKRLEGCPSLRELHIYMRNDWTGARINSTAKKAIQQISRGLSSLCASRGIHLRVRVGKRVLQIHPPPGADLVD